MFQKMLKFLIFNFFFFLIDYCTNLYNYLTLINSN